MTPLRVVAVFSFRHSGSTVLGTALAASESLSSVGETDRALLRHGKGRLTCSCRQTLHDCDRWRLDRDEVAGWPTRRPARGWRAIGARLVAAARPRSADERVQRALWEAATAARGAAVVDTSKDLRLLRRQCRSAAVDVDVIHLVRGAGPTVASCLRGGDRTGLRDAGAARRQLTAVAELARWAGVNASAGCLLRRSARTYTRLCFDDLADDPETVISELCQRLDVAPIEVIDRRVVPGPQHIVWGNRSLRSAKEDGITLRPADRSTDGLPATVRWMVGTVGLLRHPLATLRSVARPRVTR